MTTTYTTRAAHLQQAAYRRRVAAFGLPALLAPYSVARVARVVRVVRLPSQREGS